MTLELEKFIPRSPTDVWSIVTNWGIAEFWLGLERVRLMDQKQPAKQGAKLIYATRGGDQLMLITKWRPHKELGLQSTQGGVTVDYHYNFFREEAGTRVKMRAELSAEGWFWKLLLPIAKRMQQRADRKQLEALCSLVEMTTGGAGKAKSQQAPSNKSADGKNTADSQAKA